jgi:hypothetical protein
MGLLDAYRPKPQFLGYNPPGMKTEELDLEFPHRPVDIVSKIFSGSDCMPNLAGFIKDSDKSRYPYS